MKRVSDIHILARMLKELGALALMMMLTILCGVGGYLAAASIPVLITIAALGFAGMNVGLSFGAAILIIVLSAAARGLLRYAEQLSGTLHCV